MTILSINFLNGFGWTMYDAIYNTTQKYYSVGESDVIRFGEIYFYAYLVV